MCNEGGKMKKLMEIVVMFALSLFLTGCGSFSYGGKKFATRSEAEAVAFAHHRKLLEQVEPLKTPVTSKPVRCALMSRDQLKNQGLFTGRGDGLDYVATVYYSAYENVCAQIRRRNIFSGFSQAQSDGDHVLPAKGEVVIYLYTPGQGKIGWYYASEKIKVTPLHFDHAGGEEKAGKYFLDSVEALALSE